MRTGSLFHYARLGLGLVGLAVAALMISGCIASGSSRVRLEGRYISNHTLSRIEPGESSSERVLALLGEPTSEKRLENGVEIWKWTYSRTEESSGSFLFLFGGSDHEEEQNTVYVEMKGGVVQEVWRD